MKKLLTIISLVLFSTTAMARDHISVVGSSTVFPFSTTAAEGFARVSKYKAPVIESTGSGGGFKLFCKGVGMNTPDITNASRAIKQKEKEMCVKNGVTAKEYLIGYDGITISNSINSPLFKLTREEIFQAVAKEVLIDGKWVANPFTKWSEINSQLPDFEIHLMIPPPTSGTRDAFVELVMHKTCKAYGLPKKGDAGYKKLCTNVREDGYAIQMGENDTLIVQKLMSDPKALGIFGYSFLEMNMDKVQGSWVDGAKPTFDTIKDGSYPISRPLYFYVKQEHIGTIPGIEKFVKVFFSRSMMRRLADIGLIPAK